VFGPSNDAAADGLRILLEIKKVIEHKEERNRESADFLEMVAGLNTSSDLSRFFIVRYHPFIWYEWAKVTCDKVVTRLCAMQDKVRKANNTKMLKIRVVAERALQSGMGLLHAKMHGRLVGRLDTSLVRMQSDC
jgi:hypothetical protein